MNGIRPPQLGVIHSIDQLLREFNKLTWARLLVWYKHNTDLLSIWLVAELTASLRMPFSCCSRVIWLSSCSLTCWNYKTTTGGSLQQIIKGFSVGKGLKFLVLHLMRVPRQLEKKHQTWTPKKPSLLTAWSGAPDSCPGLWPACCPALFPWLHAVLSPLSLPGWSFASPLEAPKGWHQIFSQNMLNMNHKSHHVMCRVERKSLNLTELLHFVLGDGGLLLQSGQQPLSFLCSRVGPCYRLLMRHA